MIFKEVKHCILVILATTTTFAHVSVDETVMPMSVEEREELKEEAKDMFYHAYRAYMENAYPADELMPLSCKGRWKDPLNSRGDLDDTLGNFSLTLVDTLDTLVVLGDLEEFEYAVKLVIKDVSFDQDVIVSVFETNIRVLGGLLSAHILAEYFQQRAGIMNWYQAELLTMAKDLGYRLLPAFNTTTGIPHSRINLRHGLKNMRLSAHQETCTACAGTMILEMAALSRLTGEPIFEQKAHRAMDELWRMRHRSSDLMGTVLNVQSGDWVRRDSGVGAGIDSYYEYCLKAYILLGDEKYLGRFNRHYNAIMKYISQGPMLVDVHMHRPHTNSKNFMDALLAFWPGLQVLKGDIKPAVETHEMLYQVMQRHNLIPEAFTTDFHVHWGQHPLRPEFVESTYFLYKATNDPYYLEVGKAALKSLQKFARVPCGYATVKDVRTGGHDDRMDSFVLAETFKYLYLLFADPSELLLDLDEFLFTTEAHLLPLTLSRNHNLSVITINDQQMDDLEDLNSEFARCCPNTLDLFPETVRKPLKNMVDGMCPRAMRRKLHASQFTAGNSEHLKLLKNMGITVLSMSDGRVQLLHTVASARSNADAKEGLLFMQEMLELSQAQKQMPDKAPLSVVFEHNGQSVSVTAGPAHFGKDLSNGMKVSARVAVAEPLRACETLLSPERLSGRIVIIERGDCMFINKVRKVEEAGAIAAIVVDNTPGTSSITSSMFAMSGDGKNDVTIPAVFLFYQDASQLLKAIQENPGIEISIADTSNIESEKSTEEIIPPDQTQARLRSSLHDLIGKKDSDISKINVGDFHATVERLAGGKEIIRIAHRDPKSDEPKSSQDIISSLQQLNGGDSFGGEIEAPGWLIKVYEKLIVNENGKKQTEWLLKESNAGDEKVQRRLYKPDEEIGSQDFFKFKINSDEINKMVEESFNLKKIDRDARWLRILEMKILVQQIEENILKLKYLVRKKPKDWEESYNSYTSKIKTVIEKVEESVQLLDNESGSANEAECDNNNNNINNKFNKDLNKFTMETKDKLKESLASLKQLDDFAKITKDDNLVKNDDIILVDETDERTSSDDKSSEKDEL